MTQLVPAIIPHSLQDLSSKTIRVKDFDLVQIDILDGVSVPGKRSWPYTAWKEFEPIAQGDEGLPHWEQLSYEVHIMARTTYESVMDWLNAGVASIVIHPSFSVDIEKIWKAASDLDVSVWHAVTPSEIDTFEKAKRIVSIYNETSQKFFSPSDTYRNIENQGGIQIMGNDSIGQHGVFLDDRVFHMIEYIKNEGLNNIAIDIGVQNDTWQDLIDAGATKLISGSMIFSHDHPNELKVEVENYSS